MTDKILVKLDITNGRGVEFLVTWEFPPDGKKIEKILNKMERAFGDPTCPWPIPSDEEQDKAAAKRAAKRARKAAAAASAASAPVDVPLAATP